MKAYDIIGWAYDGDYHCEGCAWRRFGRKLLDDTNPPEDSEGNEVHPMFAGDEFGEDGECCGDCGAEIVEPWPDEESIEIDG